MNQTAASHHITYRFERRDFAAMTRALTQKPLGWRLAMVAAWVALFLAFLFFFAGSVARFRETLVTLPDYAAAILIPVVALLFGHHIWGLIAASVFKNNALANRDIELSLRQSGIKGGTAAICYEFDWEAVKKIIETRTHLFLALSKREALIIPRRAFASDGEYQAARRFILSQAGTTTSVVIRQ
ncbi:MAG TPA: YcxB family protein [Sinorhizobium sp.]|nr:YcxB family protein [Sinorhizobium sp.]